jgi:hypothetical protein
MSAGVLVLFGVALRVVLRPEITGLGTDDIWIKWALFATTIVLFAYSNAEDSEGFWGRLFLHAAVYIASFVYMYVAKGVIASLVLLATLAITMLVVSLAKNDNGSAWADFVYAVWLAVGVASTLGQRGIVIDPADYRSTLDLVPEEVPLRWFLDARTFVSVVLLLTIVAHALTRAFRKERSPIPPIPEWRDISEPSGVHDLIRAALSPVLGAVNAMARIVRWLMNFTWVVIATVLRVLADIAIAFVLEAIEIAVKSPILVWSARAAGSFLIAYYVIYNLRWLSITCRDYLLSDDFNQECGLLLTCFASAVAIGVLCFLHTWLLTNLKSSIASAEGTAGLLLCCVLTGVLCFGVRLLPWQYQLQGFQRAGPALWLAALIAVGTVVVALLKARAPGKPSERSTAHSSGR